MDVKPTDADLVRAARQGDAASLGILFERYRVSLYVAALRLLRSRFDADDAVQETFLIALRKLDQLAEPGAVGGWLHRVVRSVCWMRLRVDRREHPETAPADSLDWTEVEPAAGQYIDQLFLREWVWAALDRLPETLRVTALMRYFCRVTSYSEIAAALGVPVGTVRSRLNQVKTRLADALLDTAGLASTENRQRAAASACHYAAAFESMNRQRSCDDYMTTFSDDLRLVLPDGSEWDRRFWLADCEGMMRAGVKIHLANLMVSGSVLILEADLENPPDDPHHCPPATTQVHFQRGGVTYHIRPYHYSLEREQ